MEKSKSQLQDQLWSTLCLLNNEVHISDKMQPQGKNHGLYVNISLWHVFLTDT